MLGPNKDQIFPLPGYNRLCFLKNIIKNPNIIVGDKGDINIGNDVWIGYNATIMRGVTIGDGAIIATNATVTKDVAPYTIVGGNPAKEIRKRFDEDTVKKLLEMQWWNWDIARISNNVQLLTSADFHVEKFV